MPKSQGKNLVIVESPAKAKTILKFLGDGYDITASFGHIRDLPKYKLGVDIEHNFEPHYQNIKEKTKVIQELKKKAQKAPEVLIATDPDREGEAIAWHIQHAAEIPEEKIKRIVFNEITEKAVQAALKHSRKINMDLVNAQQARRVLDRLIGYKLSPILSKKIQKGLSAGRVQSIAVKLICDREKEVLAFVPEEYWVIEIEFKTHQGETFTAKVIGQKSEPDAKLQIPNEAVCTAILDNLKKSAFAVDDINISVKHRNPYAPYITSTLQQDASNRLHWSTKKTMKIAQDLYEGIEINGEPTGLITYMRTDSTRIADEAKTETQEFILKTFGEKYIPDSERKLKKGKHVQDAHEAIRPTHVDQTPDKLQDLMSPDHIKLYTLIWKRMVASQMSPSEVESTQVTIAGDTYLLKANGSRVLFDGFTKVYKSESEEPNTAMPKLTVGEALKAENIQSEQKFTQPPPRYTEASLVKELEEKGIGRPSTYAPTISVIQDRHYVIKEKRQLLPTELGMLVNDQLSQYFTNLLDVNFTAQMETQLDEIMHAKHTWQSIISDFYTPFSKSLEKAQTTMEKINMDKPTDEVCEKCGRPMVIKTGRFGEFLACTGFPECKNTKSMAKKLEMKCPDCGGDILEKHSKRGKVFYGCANYPKCKYASWENPELKSKQDETD